MMRKLILLLLSFCLCSCASMQYGNFTCIDQDKDAFIVSDTLRQIERIKIPARTTFRIYQSTKDYFGAQLAHKLREKGYGIYENFRPKREANFSYVLDRISTKNLYRLSVVIGPQTLSRAYLVRQGKVIPLGQWSHKE